MNYVTVYGLNPNIHPSVPAHKAFASAGILPLDPTQVVCVLMAGGSPRNPGLTAIESLGSVTSTLTDHESLEFQARHMLAKHGFTTQTEPAKWGNELRA